MSKKIYVKFLNTKRELKFTKYGIPYCKEPNGNFLIYKIENELVDIIGKKQCDKCKEFTYCYNYKKYQCNIINCIHKEIRENIKYRIYKHKDKNIYKVLDNINCNNQCKCKECNIFYIENIEISKSLNSNIFIEHIHILCKNCK